ncbi:metallophosphoesterase family protein [Actinoplanes philippinensis]|uniref:metallophosphoesterase family protein n=1 Tax=Actinoplanes philippinensis TaxID=35752 RepID=UPI0034089448
MKALHLSDWHLGRMTGPESRAIDHDAVLTEIIRIARGLNPDLICHSGDLFDRLRPAPEDLDRAISALTELAAIAPTVVVRGNHDSSALFRVLGRLARLHGIYFINEATVDASAVIELPTSRGSTIRLGAVPYQHPHHLIDGRGNPDSWGARYVTAVRDLEGTVGAATRSGLNPQRDFAVFAAHLHVGGASWSGTERRNRWDDTYASDAAAIPDVAYAALGHIHQPQALPGSAARFGRYAGSPLQLDFGEASEDKSVVYVEAEPGRAARIETIGLSAGRTLRRFEGALEDLERIAHTFGNDICRVVINSETQIPAFSERLEAMLPASRLIDMVNNAADRTVRMVTAESTGQDDEPDLVTMFAEYLSKRTTKRAAASNIIEVFAMLADAARDERPASFPQEHALKEVAGCDH